MMGSTMRRVSALAVAVVACGTLLAACGTRPLSSAKNDAGGSDLHPDERRAVDDANPQEAVRDRFVVIDERVPLDVPVDRLPEVPVARDAGPEAPLPPGCNAVPLLGPPVSVFCSQAMPP